MKVESGCPLCLPPGFGARSGTQGTKLVSRAPDSAVWPLGFWKASTWRELQVTRPWSPRTPRDSVVICYWVLSMGPSQHSGLSSCLGQKTRCPSASPRSEGRARGSAHVEALAGLLARSH